MSPDSGRDVALAVQSSRLFCNLNIFFPQYRSSVFFVMILLSERLENLRHSPPYLSYKDILLRISQYLVEYQSHCPNASAYWSEEIAGFEYMLTLLR